MKIGIFYGTTMGTTETVAEQLAEALGVISADVHNVADTSADKVMDYDVVLLGSSTWGVGELQDDWYDFLEALKAKDLTGKKVGLFGCGDAEGYGDTFCDAVAIIHDEIANSGCEFIGAYEPTGYSTTNCDINKDGKFIGLAIDDSNESDLSEERVASWVALIKSQF